MAPYNPEKDFVTARKVIVSTKHYHDAIAIMDAKFAAERAVKAKDSTYGSEPSSPGLSATSDSTAPSSVTEEEPVDVTLDIKENVEAAMDSLADLGLGAPVVVAEKHYMAYVDKGSGSALLREWVRDQFVVEQLVPLELDDTPEVEGKKIDASGEYHHDGQGSRFLTPIEEIAFRIEANKEDEFDAVLIDQTLEENSTPEEIDKDSGIEPTPPHSDDELELVEKLQQQVPLPKEIPTPQFAHLANVSLTVPRDVYEQTFTKQATPTISLPKACPLGKCTTACLSNPCYPIDQIIDEYRPTNGDLKHEIKTTRIYLDITGHASLISYPRSKSLRLLAQKLNEDVVTEVVDFQELRNGCAEYCFEIDISRFLRARNVVVYSTGPITGFHRDWEDATGDFDPSERAQDKLTAGRGVQVQVGNLFLGTKGEFETFATARGFTKEQRDVVVFLQDREEEEDFLNELEDFGDEVPMHNEPDEKSEYTEEEQLIRHAKAKSFEESRKFALGSVRAETKDAVVLYCVETAADLDFVQVYRQSREEEKMECEAGVLSLSGSDLVQKTLEPGDKDEVVQRVVAWLEKDDGSYESMDSSIQEKCDCSDLFPIDLEEENTSLSASALAKYHKLIASIAPALQAQGKATEEEDPEITFAFTLTNPTEANAAKEKKHIYLSTNNKEIHVPFSPPTQILSITGTNITCHEIAPLTPSNPISTKIHLSTIPTGNCIIYSTQPIDKYTLDYSLPQVKDAPRGNRKDLTKHLRANCGKYLGWAPYAVKYKMNLGNVGVKDLRGGEKVLGREEEGGE
ncbi:hypothetical protein E2P81_ATG08453 [Venturia nashicola]|uniref:Uncharacterized protein n=1 Tax=Venturia nashicola TaxID=86259 RepID=A0A4Z1NP15_9PEZI|nr:hypothetical protein E6O75_ATG08645 [Venturia nashicola]TLD20789.1 hypothetical protein E2P81_ATG08453 [Venturia nashicola]